MRVRGIKQEKQLRKSNFSDSKVTACVGESLTSGDGGGHTQVSCHSVSASCHGKCMWHTQFLRFQEEPEVK